MNHLRKINDWFQFNATLFFNITLVSLGVLLIAQSLFLLDFLPRMIGIPDSFPVRATCVLKNKTIITNLCQMTDESTNGGLENYWQPCRVAHYEAKYQTDEPIFDLNQSHGICDYWFPEVIVPGIKNQLPDINQNYSCWLSLSDNHCYIFFPEEIKSYFWTVQITLVVLWLFCGLFFIYIYRLYKNRHQITI